MSKPIRILVVCVVGVSLISVALLAGYAYGQHRMFVEIVRGYYATHGDKDLLREYCFPYPFLKKKIEQEGLVHRKEIDSVIHGYTDRMTKTADDGTFQDIYEFDMCPFGTTLLFVGYDANGRLLGIGESGPALRICE